MSQRQIERAFIRSLKTSYVGLTAVEKRIVKLVEKHEELSKSVNETYRQGFVRYGTDFRKHPGFQDDFNLIGEWENRKGAIRNSLVKLEDKHDLDRDEVMKKHRVNNTAKGYGGSF